MLDTNVWVSGLAFPDSVPGRALEALRDKRLTAVASWELAQEIAEVLRRPRVARLGIDEHQVGEALILLAPFLPTVDVAVPIRDPDDTPVVAAALAGGAEAIVTGDGDLLDDGDLRGWLGRRGVAVLTPAELLERLG